MTLLALTSASACVAQMEMDEPVGVEHGTGSASGSGSGSDVEMPAPTAALTKITVQLLNRPTNPADYGMVIAVRDGAGPWKTAPDGETFTFEVMSSTWGVAWTCETVSIPTVVFAYFATSESTSYSRTIPSYCTDNKPTMMGLSGSITNMPSSTAVWTVRHGASVVEAERASSTATTGTFNFDSGVVGVTRDLVASRTLASTTASGNYVSKAGIVRNVAVPKSTATINWTNAGITNAHVTYASPTGPSTFSTTLYTANGTVVPFGTLTAPAFGPITFESNGLSATQAKADDVYVQQLVVEASTGTTVVEAWDTMVASRELDSPAPLGGVLASVGTSSPFPKIKTQWNPYPGAVGYVWTSSQSRETGAVMWNGVVGADYVGANPELTAPDLSDLPGWNEALELEEGIQVNGVLNAVMSSRGAVDVPFSSPAPAGTYRTMVAHGWAVIP